MDWNRLQTPKGQNFSGSQPYVPMDATYSDSEKRFLRAEIAVLVSECETLWSDIEPDAERAKRVRMLREG